jgi:hypothetical protein
MAPGFRLVLVFDPFALSGALGDFGDGAIAMRVPELARLFADQSLFDGRPPRSRRVFAHRWRKAPRRSGGALQNK